MSHQQWDDLAEELAEAKTDEERKAINAKYAAIGQVQDAQLAGCDLLGVCAELTQEVRDGTDKMLELVATGKLPEGYAGGADLQFMGQRLSTDAGFRQQVGQSLSCPSVRNSFHVEFQPLFFQRSDFRGWSLIGLRHFLVLRCACFLHKSCYSRRHCPCPLRTVLLELV